MNRIIENIVPLVWDKMFKAVFIRNEKVLVKLIKDLFKIDEKDKPFTVIGYETAPYL